MKKLQFVLVGALVLASFVKTSFSALAQPTPEVFPKADLPDGGIFLPDLAHKQVAYYYLDSARYHLHPSKRKPPGLYSSINKGETWQLLSSEFDLNILFVHPVTGELFAVVPNRVYETDKDGVLHLKSFYKVISSVDGKHWKDLTQKQPLIRKFVFAISLDPDHPNRIRLEGSGWRGFYWVAVDDNYSDWKFIEIPSGPVF